MLNLLNFIAENLIIIALHLAGSSFPKPLGAAEERECIAAVRLGSPAAREKLIKHNLRLVAHIIKKFNTNQNEQEDLISIGTIGLVKAVNSFREEKGTRFSTYASRCIENEILMYFRQAKKSQGTVFINDPLDTDPEGNALTIMDIVSDDRDIEDDFERKGNIYKIKQLVDTLLAGREREVIILRYGLFGNAPLTQSEIASRLGISRSYVSRIEKRAVGILRKGF